MNRISRQTVGSSPGTRARREFPPFNCSEQHVRISISFVTIRFSPEINCNILCSGAPYLTSNQLNTIVNRKNLFYSSLGAAINEGVVKARHEIVVIVREDVLLMPDWQTRFEQSLAALEAIDCDWRILCAVGVRAHTGLMGHWNDPKLYRNTCNERPVEPVNFLDEQLTVVRKSDGAVFDEKQPNNRSIYKSPDTLSAKKCLEIRFEEIQEDPQKTIAAISSWTGLTQTADLAVVDSERARPRTEDASKKDLEKMREILFPIRQNLGYK